MTCTRVTGEGGYDMRVLLITAIVLLLVNIALVVLYVRNARKSK